MSVGERLREQRLKAGLSLGQVGEYEGLTAQYLSNLESGRNQPNVWSLLARLAKRYRTTADYLLGLTDDPSPRRDVPLPERVREVLQLAVEWSITRQDELLAHARVLDDAEREADLREYDRLMGLLEAMKDGDLAIEAVEAALRVDAAGDRAGALRLVDAFFAGRAAREESQDELEES